MHWILWFCKLLFCTFLQTEAIFNLAKSCIDVGHSLISNLAVIIDRVCSELNSTLQWSFFRPEEEHEQGENIGNARQWCDQLLECILEVRGRIVNVAQQFSYPGEANKLMFQAKFQLLVREVCICFKNQKKLSKISRSNLIKMMYFSSWKTCTENCCPICS